MSNLIPPLVSSSPPPMVTDDPDDLDDEFGDFTAAADLSFEGYSFPTTPEHATYSNYTSNSIQTQSDLIISSKIKNVDTKKVSENIFCDIKDVNTTFVIKSYTDEIKNTTFGSISNQNVQNDINNKVGVPRIDDEKSLAEHEKSDDFGDFNSFSSNKNTETHKSIENISSESNLNDLNEIVDDSSITKTEENIVPNESITENELKILKNEDIKVNKSIKELFNTESTSIENIHEANKEILKIEVDSDISQFSINDKSTTSDQFSENSQNDDKTNKNQQLNEDNQQTTEENQKHEDNRKIAEVDHRTVEDNQQTSEDCQQIDKGDLQTMEDNQQASEECQQIAKADQQIAELDQQIAEVDQKIAEVDLQAVEDDQQTSEDRRQTSEDRQQTSEDYQQTAENDQQTNILEDFGEFHFNSTENESKNKQIEQTENINDEFGEFFSPVLNLETEESLKNEDFYFPITQKILRETKIDEDTRQSEDDFGDFTLEIENTQSDTTEFGALNFNFPPLQSSETAQKEEIDDFGDFSDYTAPTNLDLSSTKSVENAEKVIKNLFVDPESDLTEIEVLNFIENALFKQLLDIENTNALNYQWASSESQKMMLKGLNIDSRNILFGPRWNASMPRFAANLGFTPLEPVKSEVLTSGTPLTPEPQNCDIPAAKFDWTSSGLVNPLDLQSTREESETRRLSEISGPVHLDLSILNNFGSDNESVNSLKFIETPADIDNEIKFETEKVENENSWSPIKLPIKESHISSEAIENKILKIEQIELESTIVTPELTRKNFQEIEEEDDFTDFQMSLPPKQLPVPQETNQKSEFVPAVPLKPIVLEPSVINKTSTQINWPEPGIIEEFDISYVSTKKIEEKTKQTEEEEDWSDFVCAQQPETNKTQMSNNLELSIPNLQNTHLTNKNSFIPNTSPTKTLQQIGYNCQPPYQIQTINTPFGGLPQTSLSAFNSFTVGPTELPQNIPTRTNSNNIFDGPFNSFQMNPQNSSVPSKESLNSKDDDDDWSDFVSSQPTNGQKTNSFNIYANPVHFDAFQNFQSSSGDKSKKNSIPSISALPELDFIAPKNKFFSKK